MDDKKIKEKYFSLIKFKQFLFIFNLFYKIYLIKLKNTVIIFRTF